MAILPILTGNHPILRQKAKKIGKVDRSILRLLDDMVETMRAAPGIGLAAPQVGQLIRAIVIEVEDSTYQLINPEIVKCEGDVVMEEGCLSLPGYYGDVRRPEKISVKAFSRVGKPVRINADGILARVLQHEIDHLNGVMFIDRLDSLSDLRHVTEDEEAEKEEAKVARG